MADSSPAPATPRRDAFVIVTGLSGSGKSLVHRCFEDLGYFCVDNLPIELIPKLADMRERGGPALGRLALTVDVREREFLGEFPAVLEDLRRRHGGLQLLFLEADDPSLVRRFSESRRPHPLSGQLPLVDAIAEERRLLASLRADADLVLDTSELNVHELRRQLSAMFADPGEATGLHVSLLSFGFRYGLPRQADLVLDVRFLPNPYFEENLRPLSGLDPAIRDFLSARTEHRDYLELLWPLLRFLVPAYEREGKAYLTVAVGCTGGRHRSVALIEELREGFAADGRQVTVSHRDCDR